MFGDGVVWRDVAWGAGLPVHLTRRLFNTQKQTERQVFLRCLAGSLFLNIAQRVPPSQSSSGRGCYKALQSGREVGIHPSSVLHGRNPPPPYVVYTEVLTTSRTYIRGVTIADAAAVREQAGQFMTVGSK